MIALPPNVSINYDVTIQVSQLSGEMLNWYQQVGGKVTKTKWYDGKWKEHLVPVVQYGDAKPSHKMLDGTGNFIIRFKSQDAHVGLMFILKFADDIVSHNMRDIERYVY